MTATLVPPAVGLHAAWLEGHAEWGPGLHEDGFGLSPTDDVESAGGFADWVARLTARAEQCTSRWILDGGQVQGGIVLRHRLDERTGHVGYGIRPSARGQGLATWALARMIEEARTRGMHHLLLVCEADNTASVRTVERNGGRLEEVRLTAGGPTRRYRIDVAAS